MKLTDVLSEDAIVPELRGQTKGEVVRELALNLAATYPGIDAARLEGVLWERERLGSTAIGDGIAIPHAKLSGLTRVVGAFARHPRGVDFDALDGQPSKLFFVLVAPEDSVGQHLKALARVSRLLRDAEFRDRLVASADRESLYRAIKEEDDKY
jgi:PTS system nitrogen regulatory IIA component